MDFSKYENTAYLEAQYRLWLKDPAAVAPDWRTFFEGFHLAQGEPAAAADARERERCLKQSGVEALICRYREIGHLLSCLDPLSACPTEHPLLALEAFHLSAEDLDTPFDVPTLFADGPLALRRIIELLRATYCRSVGVEYMHLQDPTERRWLQDRMEPVRNAPELARPDRLRMLAKLCESERFEAFLNRKYLAQTRFSLEGADALIPMLDGLLDHAAGDGCREIILGMSHRGRLNVQAHILQRPYREIFDEFSHCYDPDSLTGSGDVKYHNGYLADVETAGRHPLRIFLVNNPSHLETVDPVAEGFARARQDLHDIAGRQQVLPLLLHGDAGFAGQGIVAETLNLSQLSGYETGGTIHIVVNNQIGYTTLPENARSTRYATDIAKMLMVPIFHVHGEDPETALHIVRLAWDYRRKFSKDAVIDLICYRRYGHNEGDDPYFTQPLMYARIKERPPLFDLYARRLKSDALSDDATIERLQNAADKSLEDDFQASQQGACPFPQARFYEYWEGFHGSTNQRPEPTPVAAEALVAMARSLNRLPRDFSLNPKLERILNRRLESVESGAGIDWATAEALAFAALLKENIPIRLSGQDSGRGTFSQRHSVLYDAAGGAAFVPLNHLGHPQAEFAVFDSPLSEAAVLGFEYGYALAQPNGLVLWEAQFGDFADNAQAIVDLYIASGEAKWQRLCGLVLLLPHGYEGLGPEHSSARPERYLQLCAQDNLQLCNPTTPAQYFHLLRRQARSNLRKPLIVLTPKSLLRHPLAVSTLDEFAHGGFAEIRDDPAGSRNPRRVLFCSGKIFYELLKKRDAAGAEDTAIVRIEQLYPFPQDRLAAMLQNYSRVEKWRWVQEEPQNMGAWNYIRPYLAALLPEPPEYCGRKASAATATGFPEIYKQEQAQIAESAFAQ